MTEECSRVHTWADRAEGAGKAPTGGFPVSIPVAEYSPSQLLPSSLRGLLSSLSCCGVDHIKGSALVPVIFKNNSFHLLNLDLDFLTDELRLKVWPRGSIRVGENWRLSWAWWYVHASTATLRKFRRDQDLKGSLCYIIGFEASLQ